MPSVEGNPSFLAIPAHSTYPGFISTAYAVPVIQNVLSSSFHPPSISNSFFSGASTLSNGNQLSCNTNFEALHKGAPVIHPSRACSNRTILENNSTSLIRRKRSGHVSKSRVPRRAIETVNLKKSCPGCFKFWKNCTCSNIKNRPDPKPYCKFVPPRMLKKQTGQ